MPQQSHRLILASASERRKELLKGALIKVDGYYPADIDETQHKGEKPRELVKRLAYEKGKFVYDKTSSDSKIKGKFILSADTIVNVGARILQKPADEEEAWGHLKLLSGKNHRVYSGICVFDVSGNYRVKVVESRVKFKRLSADELEAYIKSGEWHGKAGSYAIQGLAGNFVIKIIGSYSSIVGLPLYESVNLLIGMGYPVYKLIKEQ